MSLENKKHSNSEKSTKSKDQSIKDQIRQRKLSAIFYELAYVIMAPVADEHFLYESTNHTTWEELVKRVEPKISSTEDYVCCKDHGHQVWGADNKRVLNFVLLEKELQGAR